MVVGVEFMPLVQRSGVSQGWRSCRIWGEHFYTESKQYDFCRNCVLTVVVETAWRQRFGSNFEFQWVLTQQVYNGVHRIAGTYEQSPTPITDSGRENLGRKV